MKSQTYEKYKNDVVPALKEKHNYKNVHQIPKMVKIVVNMGVSASLEKGVKDAAKDTTWITGRKPVSKSRHSIAQSGLREGQNIGCRVTLRKDAMYEFLTGWSQPRCRVSAIFAVCRRASLTAAEITRSEWNDQAIFPEIELEKVKRGCRAWTSRL